MRSTKRKRPHDEKCWELVYCELPFDDNFSRLKYGLMFAFEPCVFPEELIYLCCTYVSQYCPETLQSVSNDNQRFSPLWDEDRPKEEFRNTFNRSWQIQSNFWDTRKDFISSNRLLWRDDSYTYEIKLFLNPELDECRANCAKKALCREDDHWFIFHFSSNTIYLITEPVPVVPSPSYPWEDNRTYQKTQEFRIPFPSSQNTVLHNEDKDKEKEKENRKYYFWRSNFLVALVSPSNYLECYSWQYTKPNPDSEIKFLFQREFPEGSRLRFGASRIDIISDKEFFWISMPKEWKELFSCPKLETQTIIGGE